MLRELRIKNFRLLRDVTLTIPRGKPVILIGPNVSGKSTILEVIDFLSRCAADGIEAAVASHGGMASLRSEGVSAPIELGTSWYFIVETSGTRGRKEEWSLEWDLVLGSHKNGTAKILGETLFRMKSGKMISLVSTDKVKRRFVFPEESPGTPSEVKSGALLSFQDFIDADKFRGLWWLRALLMNASTIGTISAASPWGRTEPQSASPRTGLFVDHRRYLDKQGAGLANVLFHIFTEHAAAWKALDEAFRREFPFVRRLTLPADEGGLTFSFCFEDFRFPGRKFSAAEMSDGMIAYLCLLTAVLNPDQGGVLGLDEPELHLHPAALRRFMAIVQRQHSRRELIIVTHSNALLDELSHPAESIRIMEAPHGQSTIRTLDPEVLAGWREHYSLSQMRQMGLLDRADLEYGWH